MSALRLAAATLIAVAAAGSTGAAATPRVSHPLFTFAVDDWLGLCATDMQGNSFRLTAPRQSSMFASWSPDGRLLAYMDGFNRLVMVDVDGRVRREFNNRGGNSGFAGLVWSPDSSELAGIGYWGPYTWLWAMKADGSGGRDLANGVASLPSWSPDGHRILFANSLGVTYVIDSDGRNPRKLLDSSAEPVWSPDGQRFAYAVLDADRKSAGLAIAQADGSDPHTLVQGNISGQTWSPDGSTIAFTIIHAAGTSPEVALVKPDGTDEHAVAPGARPVWAPDGSWIAFTLPMQANEPARFAVVRPDGTDQRTIETGLPGAGLYYPSWRLAAPLPTHRRPCVVKGTQHADVLRGTNRGDVLFGAAGNDAIHGSGGKDVLFGGSGNDRLFGGPGNDFFMTRDAKRDYLFGGQGSDRGSYDLYRDRVKSIEHYVAE